MRNREKENVGPNYGKGRDQPLSFFGEPQMPISPVKRKQMGQSLITNVFDQYVKSTQEIGLPTSLSQKGYFRSQPQSDNFIKEPIDQANDPECIQHWKKKYDKLMGSYESLNRKCESRTKEMYRMQETIDGQANHIRQLEEQNSELNSRINGMMTQTQRNSRWSNNYSLQGPDPSTSGINRFYVEELERNIDNLQRQNKRLSEIVMRKVKYGYDF